MIFKGAPYPIRSDPRGYFRTQTSLDQVKSDLLILLLTYPGERVMLPDFGVPLKDLIFEPNDPTLATQARQMIINAIEKWEPRITVQAITVSQTIDEASLDTNDLKQDLENILSIKIVFFDPENIQAVQDLVLEVPLGGSS